MTELPQAPNEDSVRSLAAPLVALDADLAIAIGDGFVRMCAGAYRRGRDDFAAELIRAVKADEVAGLTLTTQRFLAAFDTAVRKTELPPKEYL